MTPAPPDRRHFSHAAKRFRFNALPKQRHRTLPGDGVLLAFPGNPRSPLVLNEACR